MLKTAVLLKKKNWWKQLNIFFIKVSCSKEQHLIEIVFGEVADDLMIPNFSTVVHMYTYAGKHPLAHNVYFLPG